MKNEELSFEEEDECPPDETLAWFDEMAEFVPANTRVRELEELARATEDFLARGGQIQQIPYGVCADYVPNPNGTKYTSELKTRWERFREKERQHLPRMDELLNSKDLYKSDFAKAMRMSMFQLTRMLTTYFWKDPRAARYLHKRKGK